MVDIVVSVDDKLHAVLRAMAELKGVPVDEVLSRLVADQLDEIRARMSDPLIGALDEFETDEDDTAARAEDILRSDWKPD